MRAEIDGVREGRERSEAPAPVTEPLSRCGPAELPRQLAQLMRQELPAVSEAIVAAVRAEVAAYARLGEGEDAEYGHAVQVGVDEAITAFVEEVADPGIAHGRRDEVMRRLGEGEWREGRTLTELRAAFRIGGQVAWRHIMTVGSRYGLPRELFVCLADMLFDYLDTLSAIAQDGYVRAQREFSDTHGATRRRLLRLIVDRNDSARGMIRELAGLVGWPVPERVSVVAVGSRASGFDELSCTDILVDAGPGDVRLLVPGTVSGAREHMLAGALPNVRMAIGPAVPIEKAADSARWAGRALAMAESGTMHAGRIVRCDDHLLDLLLLADEGLLGLLADQQLSGFGAVPSRQRESLMETLVVTLQSNGTAAEVGKRLGVHAQTVRYRLRQIESTIGARLHNPDSRFALEVVTRASGLRNPPVC